MSVYGQVQTDMTDLDVLAQACDRLRLAYKVGEGLAYHKWISRGLYRRGRRGTKRGNDAVLVIENLDTVSWCCGETAFVPEGGKLRAEIDIAHGNAPENWRALQAEYNVILCEQQAARQGLRVERSQAADGRITLRLVPQRGAARTTPTRAAASRPVPQRGG